MEIAPFHWDNCITACRKSQFCVYKNICIKEDNFYKKHYEKCNKSNQGLRCDRGAEPLLASLIRRYHHCLTYGTYSDKKHQIGVGEYRKGTDKLGVSARQIPSKLDELIRDYEEDSIDFDAVLDFHVHFEKIHPFDDYNGRVGRIIIVKECLRHGIIPFIIDDKHRGEYNKGIKCWNTNPTILREVCLKAQDRFKRQIEFQRLLQRTRNA